MFGCVSVGGAAPSGNGVARRGSFRRFLQVVCCSIRWCFVGGLTWVCCRGCLVVQERPFAFVFTRVKQCRSMPIGAHSSGDGLPRHCRVSYPGYVKSSVVNPHGPLHGWLELIKLYKNARHFSVEAVIHAKFLHVHAPHPDTKQAVKKRLNTPEDTRLAHPYWYSCRHGKLSERRPVTQCGSWPENAKRPKEGRAHQAAVPSPHARTAACSTASSSAAASLPASSDFFFAR